MRNGFVFVFTFLACATAQSPPSAPRNPPSTTVQETTICEIAKNPRGFDGSIVSAHAHVDGDGLERIGISDAACPDQGIPIKFPRSGSGFTRVEDLWRAINCNGPISMAIANG